MTAPLPSSCLWWCVWLALTNASLLGVQIREKEADIDVLITPIEDMYSLLLRYEVRGSCWAAAESDTVSLSQPQ